MRNFEERKAEIFRRSEERIRQRKRKQRRILSVGIPLCLILLVWSFYAMPSILYRNDKNTAPEEEMAVVGSAELKGGTYIQVEFLCDDDELSEVSTAGFEKAEKIHRLLESFLPIEEESGSDGTEDSEEGKKENSSQSGNTEFATDYRITFVKEDGAGESYTLRGSVLTEEKTKRKVILTKDQRTQILNELGL